jgi:sortase A
MGSSHGARPRAGADPRRSALLLAALLVAVLTGCGASAATAPTTTARPVDDSPQFIQVKRAPPSTTTTAAAVQTTRPIDVPSDPYAPEPVKHIGSMEIPRIGLRHDIYEGITLHNIDRGPSHWPGSALPGEAGNSVFAAHRVTHSHPFRRIDELVPGDEVTFDVGGARSAYRVVGNRVVSPEDTWIANASPTPTATLFACHPPGSARYRYVVHLELVTGTAAASSGAPTGSM